MSTSCLKRYTRTDFKINTELASDLNITSVWDKIQDYGRNWMEHKNRMPPNRLPADQKGEANSRDDWIDFLMCESGMGKQEAQLRVS
jgi:hypothetical protein